MTVEASDTLGAFTTPHALEVERRRDSYYLEAFELISRQMEELTADRARLVKELDTATGALRSAEKRAEQWRAIATKYGSVAVATWIDRDHTVRGDIAIAAEVLSRGGVDQVGRICLDLATKVVKAYRDRFPTANRKTDYEG